MSTQITHEYKYKIFSKAQLKQFALKLAHFYEIPTSNYHIFLHYKKDGYETSIQSTLDELDDNICKIGTPLASLGFHYKSDIITLTLKVKGFPDILNIWYMLNGDIEYSKRLIFFIENSLELTRLEEEISEPTDVLGRNTPDTSSANGDSINSLVTVWHNALTQLQLICSAASYQTWIAPIVPSAEGNQLILNCPNEFAKDWVESRYMKDIIEMIQSSEPSVEGIITRVSGKGTNQSDEATNKWLFLEIDEPLLELMKQVYERETKNADGCSFDQYFNQVIQLHCHERMNNFPK
ncbi:DnaA N-terminal domain-containing protein [Desulfosporosinus nitroreducens]|uniref:DnaA N-terminal domain-containing protein n=1 Tax=Desulfosporosinus nitroreducens TaxID=2018668 RepID=A0ABT8QR22_9FIRM|nr:DnaA N-terminal domain-containing protein [Desulfosporosinus nitroreducens]MDO0823095.1 hypothetical protein [Desulfosporosinus nitroreducens]